MVGLAVGSVVGETVGEGVAPTVGVAVGPANTGVAVTSVRLKARKIIPDIFDRSIFSLQLSIRPRVAGDYGTI
jgi:hypothetical protein